MLDMTTGVETKITNLNAYSYGRPFILPGGQHVVFSYQSHTPHTDTTSVVVDISRPDSKQYLTAMPGVVSLQLSANGRRIVYTMRTNQMDGVGAGAPFNYDLFLWESALGIVDTDGVVRPLKQEGAARRLTKAGAYLSGYSLSADGGTLAYALDASRNGNLGFFLMDLETGQVLPFRLPEKTDGWIETDTQPES